jgi:HEPN domain-containing protein
MAAIHANCPHCSGRMMGFSFVAEASLAPRRPGAFLTLFKCNKCQGGFVVEYEHAVNRGPSSPGQCTSDPQELGFVPTKTYPGSMPSSMPSHVGAPLDRYYSQAAESLQSGHYDASGAMSRKVVDVSTQQKLGEDSKKYGNIRDRIDAMAAKSLLTPELKDWAHQIRLGGNDAAHDEDPYTKEEAEDLLSFAELYLTYVYSLPGRLKARQEAAAKAKAKAKAEAKKS